MLVLGVPSGNLTQAPPPRDPQRAETLGGAWQRAERRLDVFNRQLHLDQENVGLWGRINSSRDEGIESLRWPSLNDATENSYRGNN